METPARLALLDSYIEYLPPLWIWPHWLLARFLAIRYAANLHDPVRNYVVGPRMVASGFPVRLAYLPLDFVLVHDKLPDPSPVPPRSMRCRCRLGFMKSRSRR